MKTLYIASMFRHTGKHLVGLGIAKELMRKKKKVGFLHPVGLRPVKRGKRYVDEDAEFFKKMLGAKEPLHLLCPIVLESRLMRQSSTARAPARITEIEKAYRKVGTGKDAMIVLGFGNIWSGPYIGVDQICLIKKMNAKVLFVCSGDVEVYDVVDFMIPARKAIGDNLIGLVFNRVPRERFEDFKHRVVAPLKKHWGLDTLGIIQVDDMLGSVTVRNLLAHINGRIICGHDFLERPVERYAIGAMNLESATRYFRKIPRKAVITGGDRSDIQLAALETSTRCLILTGKNLHPAPIIISRADELGIPIAEVATDTFTVVHAVEHLFGHTSLRNEEKAERAAEIVQKNVNLGKIFRKLGL